NLRHHFNRFSVKQRGPVNPLPDRFLSRCNQQRMAANQLKIAHMSVFANDDRETHSPLHARLLCERRIDRVDLMEKARLHYVGTNLVWVSTAARRRGRRWRR